jgi:hypothetical protein
MTDENYWYGAPKAGEEFELVIEGVEQFKANILNFGQAVEAAISEAMKNIALNVLERKRAGYVDKLTNDWDAATRNALMQRINLYDAVIDDLRGENYGHRSSQDGRKAGLS